MRRSSSAEGSSVSLRSSGEGGGGEERQFCTKLHCGVVCQIVGMRQSRLSAPSRGIGSSGDEGHFLRREERCDDLSPLRWSL